MINEENLRKSVIDVLSSPDAFTKYDEQKNMFVVLVNGKRVKMNSGKVVWPSIGAAKNALRCHLESLFYSRKIRNNFITSEDGTICHNLSRNVIREVENEWINKHVAIVPFTDYIGIIKKLTK